MITAAMKGRHSSHARLPLPPSGGESQAAGPSVPQEEQGGHPVPDGHAHHLRRRGGRSAQ